MKKTLIAVTMLFLMTILMVACNASNNVSKDGDDKTQESTPTPQEIIEKAINKVKVPSVIYEDFQLPVLQNVLTNEVTVSWTTDISNFINIENNTGRVNITRPAFHEAHANGILTGSFVFQGINSIKSFEITVLGYDFDGQLTSITNIRASFEKPSVLERKVSFQGKVVGVSDMINSGNEDAINSHFNAGNFFIVTDGTNNLIIRGTNGNREIFDYIRKNIIVGQFIMLINALVTEDRTGILSSSINHSVRYVQLNNPDNLFEINSSRLDDDIMPYNENTTRKVIQISQEDLKNPDFLNNLLNYRNKIYIGVQFKFTDMIFSSNSASLASTAYSWLNFGSSTNEIGLFRTHINVEVSTPTTFTAFFIGVGGSGQIRLSIVEIINNAVT